MEICIALTSFLSFSFPRCGLPHGAQLVAVEMGGTPLADFEHPPRAVYVLGAEDAGIPGLLLKACQHHVRPQPAWCSTIGSMWWLSFIICIVQLC